MEKASFDILFLSVFICFQSFQFDLGKEFLASSLNYKAKVLGDFINFIKNLKTAIWLVYF